MDADLIAYETLMATQDASRWAFWSMIAAAFTAAATCIAVFVAIRALTSWKAQTRSQELKDFSLAVYNFHTAVIRGPEIKEGKELDDFEFRQKMFVYESLDMVYKSTISMHDLRLRGNASRIYSELCAIQTAYLDCEIEKKEADTKILQIRTTNALLISSY